MSVTSDVGTSTVTLSTLDEAADGDTWYVDVTANFNLLNRTFSASLTGYRTAWYTYAKTPAENGPKSATKLLSSGTDLSVTSSNVSQFCLKSGSSSDTLLYAVFTPITYTVSFNVNGGDGSYASKTVSYDEEFTVDDPTRTGYTFAGWTMNGKTYASGATFKNLTATDGATVTLTAQWTPNKYSLALVFAEGVTGICYRVGAGDWTTVNSSTSVDVDCDASYAVYALVDEHYSYTSSGSSSANPQKGTMTTDGVTFAPVPTKKSYHVTVTSNPSDGGTTKGDGTYEYLASATLEATAQTGWNFVNWSDGSTANPHEIVIGCATNVSANFSREIYSVTFVYRNASGAEVSEVQSVAYGGAAVPPPTSRYDVWPGHVFDAWDNGTYKTISGNLTVKATYRASKYALRFDGNGATSGSTVDEALAYDVEEYVSASSFSRTGYEFQGWSTTPDGAVVYQAGQRVVNIVTNPDGTPAADGTKLTLYAVWQPITYTIRFAANGAEGSMADLTVKYDETIVLPESSFQIAQSLVCWQGSDGKSYLPGESVARLASTADAVVTMTAVWTEVCTVQFCEGEQSGETYKQSFQRNEETPLLVNSFSRTGYLFSHWTNDVGEVFEDQALMTNPVEPGETTNLYAVWTPITYEISFDANGGSGTMASQTVAYDETPQISNSFQPAADGWTFVGWGTNTTDVLDEVKNLTTIEGDHIRLYAIWQMNVGEWSEYLGCKNLKFTASETYWERCEDSSSTYVRRRAVASTEQSIAAQLTGSGTLSLEWWAEKSAAKLIVKSGTLVETNKCDQANEWKLITVKIVAAGELYLVNNPYGTAGYCCRIRNVKWTPDPIQTTTKTYRYSLGTYGTRVGGGAIQQEVPVDGQSLLPTIQAKAGWTFVGWDEIENEEDFAYYKAQYALATNRLIYANTKGFVNSNATTFVMTDEWSFAPLATVSGGAVSGFLGWSPAALPSGTTSNLVVTALWAEASTVTHTVTFVSGVDGSVTNRVSVEDGKNALLPEADDEAGYLFEGWLGSVDAVRADTVVRANYSAIPYAIVYENTQGAENGNPLSYDVSQEVQLGILTTDDTNLTFLGWSPTNAIARGSTGTKTFIALWRSGNGPSVIAPASGATPTLTATSVDGVDSYLLDPKGQKVVELSNASGESIVVDDASDFVIRGAGTVTVRANGCDITDYVTGGDASTGFDTSLSTNAVLAVLNDVEGIAAPFALDESAATWTFKPIAGLTYTLVSADSLTSEYEPVTNSAGSAVTLVPTSSSPVCLIDDRAPTTRRFYRIVVTK